MTVALFKKESLERAFDSINPGGEWTENARRMLQLRSRYVDTIDAVVHFLQGKNPTFAHRIAQRNFLPEASRFSQLDNLDIAFGSMGIQDKAKHLGTLYLEDLSDLIQECLDPHFGFSRYAERLARSANSFDTLYEALLAAPSFVDNLLFDILDAKLKALKPSLVALSVPFPGNLFSGLRCGQFIKKHFPEIKVAMGGGYPNTELRSLAEPRVFEFVDFVTMDDGEAPIENLLSFAAGNLPLEGLKRTFIRQKDNVVFVNNANCADYRQGQVGTPDYDDLLLDEYIGAIEITNPMHSLWSDGRWNKLTMAHGCYWGKCTFCDISLPYIANYEPLTATMLADRMQEMMDKTGTSGFHFVDEATPPALMRALALEIISRKMVLSWWANIRFEKAFTRDLCQLLKASGCIAISGGLEVASDRLLALIKKGITLSQVARVNKHFMEAGIMVHAYLMYGFPTQTTQETIDSLEMVRQMFQAGILQSAYWHQFAMTAHAPIGLHPELFGVEKEEEGTGRFANNDLIHYDPTGADHESFSYGLKKSLINYMNGIGFEKPVQQWFEQKLPRPSVDSNFIVDQLMETEFASTKPNAKLVFIGSMPRLSIISKSKKGATWELASLNFETAQKSISIKVALPQGQWLMRILEGLKDGKSMTMAALKANYEATGLEDFELFWDNKPMDGVWRVGLLVL